MLRLGAATAARPREELGPMPRCRLLAQDLRAERGIVLSGNGFHSGPPARRTGNRTNPSLVKLTAPTGLEH